MRPVKSNKRKALTAAEKLHLLTAIENKRVRTLTDLSIELGVPRTTLSTIWANKTSISKVAEETNVKTRKKQRKSDYQPIDQALFMWFKEKRQQNVPLNSHVLKAKAEEFSGHFHFEGSICSEGCLSRWRERHGIRSKVISGESNTVNLSNADRWKETELKKIFDDYPARNVFNGEQTGVFWRLLPKQIFCLPGELS